MTKEKQIEEMREKIRTEISKAVEGGLVTWTEFADWLAEALYNAGYRKHTDFSLKENGEIIPLLPKQSEGEWIDEPNFAQKGLKGKYYVCTNCNVCVPAIKELPLFQWEFCPRCGAKMKGEAKNDL